MYIENSGDFTEDTTMISQDTATIANCLEKISSNLDWLRETTEESELPTLKYPQTVLQLLLQTLDFYHTRFDCDMINGIARCMVVADMRPMSEILEDAKPLAHNYDENKEYDFASGLIGRLIIKALQ